MQTIYLEVNQSTTCEVSVKFLLVVCVHVLLFVLAATPL